MVYQGRLDVDGGGGKGFLLSGLFIPTKGVIRDLTVLPSVPISFLGGKRFMVGVKATCMPDSVVKTKRNKSDWLFGNEWIFRDRFCLTACE
jgi:hypothetical protein